MKTKIDKNIVRLILVMGSVIEARDAYTGGHTWRVSQYARLLSEQYGLSNGEQYIASLGGFVHDLGKVGIPDAILRKPERLTKEEFEIIKLHPEIGKDILKEHSFTHLILDAVSLHHERNDGMGYPYGYGGDEIPLMAKIVSIADAFDAMTSARPYSKNITEESALSILTTESNKQFDKKLVQLFQEISESGKAKHIIGHSDFEQKMLNCPNCGPVIAVPKTAGDGSIATCKVCSSKFRLHQKEDTYDLEFTNEKAKTIKPEVELDQINNLVQNAPRSVKI